MVLARMEPGRTGLGPMGPARTAPGRMGRGSPTRATFDPEEWGDEICELVLSHSAVVKLGATVVSSDAELPIPAATSVRHFPRPRFAAAGSGGSPAAAAGVQLNPREWRLEAWLSVPNRALPKPCLQPRVVLHVEGRPRGGACPAHRRGLPRGNLHQSATSATNRCDRADCGEPSGDRARHCHCCAGSGGTGVSKSRVGYSHPTHTRRADAGDDDRRSGPGRRRRSNARHLTAAHARRDGRRDAAGLPVRNAARRVAALTRPVRIFFGADWRDAHVGVGETPVVCRHAGGAGSSTARS